MSIFDQEAPEPVGSPVSHGEVLMQAHVSAHPGFEGPELPTQDGNRYTLPDADGKPVTWNGATTLAKELDNPYAITQWQLRQAVHGVGIRPDLAKLAGAAKPDDKETLRKVVKDALAAAATEAGANEGTAWHMAFERVDRGESIEALPEFFHAGIRNRQAELQRHGIEILPEYIERAVRCLMYKVSGKLDRIGLYEGQFVIIDDKSEKDPLSYPKAKTIQMAIYAYAGELFDPATFTIEPMPDVRKDIAIMLHFDKTTHECKAYRVPIDIGWWGARLAREVREWRKMDCLIAPLVSLGSWTPKPVAQEVVSDNGHSAVDSVATEALRDDASSLDSVSAEDIAVAGSIIGAIEELGDLSRWSAPKLPEGDDLVSRQIREFEQSVPPNPGIDRVAQEIEWLQTKKTKPQLSALCDKVGIKDVAHHRAWLAKEYIAARNAGGQSSIEQQLPTMSAVVQDEVDFVEAVGFQAIPANPVEEIFNKIELAETKQDLQRIYAEITEDNKYPERWPAEATKAGLDRIQAIEDEAKVAARMQPVTDDNPFRD
jgi:hypothetical protein